jgi:hypothetical protein
LVEAEITPRDEIDGVALKPHDGALAGSRHRTPERPRYLICTLNTVATHLSAHAGIIVITSDYAQRRALTSLQL